MAIWTDIATAALEPGKPARSVDAIALRDNPIALAEGAAGAPRILTAAYANGSITDQKIASVSWSKLFGRPALGAYYSTGEYAMSVTGAFEFETPYRVPSGYVVTGVGTRRPTAEATGPYLMTIYARGLAV